MAEEIIQKTCTICKASKPLSEFAPQKLGRHGTTASCRLCRRELNRTYRAANPERARERGRQEYRRNKAARLLRRANWGKNNPNKVRAQQQRYYYKNREAVVSRHKTHGKTYRKKYPEKSSQVSLRRYYALRSAAGFCSDEAWMAKCKYHGWCCYLCGIQLSPSSVERDHRIPVCRGGANWPANLAPVCTPCNSSKGTKTEAEYKAFQSYISGKFH